MTLNLNDKEKSLGKDTWENQIMKRSCKDFKINVINRFKEGIHGQNRKFQMAIRNVRKNEEQNKK